MKTNGTRPNFRKMITLTNLITNGNFANGTTGWIAQSVVTASAGENELTFLVSSGYAAVYQNNSITGRLSHKVYFFGSVRADSNEVQLWLGDNKSATNVHHSGSGSYERLSGIRELSPLGTAIILFIVDARSSNWTNNSVKNCGIIDLTAVFGAGNEPSKAWMDRALLELYPDTDGWFDGTSERLVA